MPEETVPTTKTNYWRTGLLVIATAMPAVVWGAKQVIAGGMNAFNGKNNDPVIDDED